MGDFDPYLDYSSVTEEMVTDMSGALNEYKTAADEMIVSPSRGALERLMKSHDDLDNTASAIRGAIWTIPVLVHIAGEVEDDDEDEGKIQRCQRCKSPLAGWAPNTVVMSPEGPRDLTEDEVGWHDVGQVVAKSGSTGVLRMYYIEDNRELESHERECVGLPQMEN